MIPETSLQGFLVGYFTILGLLALFIIPYYIIVRRFFPEVSIYKKIIFAFILSQGVKLALFGTSVVTQVPLRYLFIGESMMITILTIILIYCDKNFLSSVRGISKEKIVFVLISILIIWFFLYRFSNRYEWDAIEFYLPYAKLYVTENKLIGFSEEISNYLYLPPLQPTVIAWVFSLAGVNDDLSFFLPLINMLMLALVTYEIAKKFLKQEFFWLATALSVFNILMIRYISSMPRYVDLPFAVLTLVFFLALFGSPQTLDRKHLILSFFILSEAVFTKISFFSLYLLIALLLIPLFWPRFASLANVATWVWALFVIYFIFPTSNIAIASENLPIQQVVVLLLLFSLTILHKIALRFYKNKSPPFKVILYAILLLIPILSYLFYLYSSTGQPLYLIMKTDSISSAVNLLVDASVRSGRIESNPLSILYFMSSPMIGPFLPFFILYLVILGRRVYKGKIGEKDLFALQLLFLMLLLILFDYTTFGTISNRRHISTYIIYQMFCIAGFSSLIKASHKKLLISSLIYFIINLLFSIWKIDQLNLDLQYTPLSLVKGLDLKYFDLSLLFINGAVFVAILIYYAYSRSKNHLGLEFEKKKSKDKKTRITKIRLGISANLILLLVFSLFQMIPLNDWTRNTYQQEILETLSELPKKKVLTVGLCGEYYYAETRSLDIFQVEGLNLIYPEYANSISSLICRLKELDVQYAIVPDNNWATPWFLEIVNDAPAMQILISEKFFPLIKNLNVSKYTLRRLNDNLTIESPTLITIIAQGEQLMQIDGKHALRDWISLGSSEDLTLNINFITPIEILSVKSIRLKGQYIVGNIVENITIVPSYTLSERIEAFYTLSVVLTGSKTEENQIIKISEINIELQNIEGDTSTLRLVSNHDKPLAIWYIPINNVWVLEQGTFLLHQEFEDFNSN